MNPFGRSPWRFATILVMAGASACATSGANLAAIPRLEQDRSAHPNSAPVLRALGIAYYRQNRLDDARSTLQEASRLDPGDGVVALYLGLTAEAQNDIPAARAAYLSYEKVGRTQRVRSELQGRLALLEQKQLQLDATAAIQREAQLSSSPPPPHTVAVLPFKFAGSDTTLRPLERGFADLLTTDLSRSPSLIVLERARMQAILDELALQQTGATDASTAVRAGHLIQAASLVSGDISQSGTELNTTAEVVSTTTSAVEGSPATDNESLDRVFDIEKKIALDLFSRLGITLTTAQQNEIEQRPTKSLTAFLAYSRGLQAEDAGRFDDASRFFQDATRLDPKFGAAAEKNKQAKAAAASAQVSATMIQSSLSGTEGAVVSAAAQGSTAAPSENGAASTTANALNPSPAQAASQTGVTAVSSSPAQNNTPGAAAGTGADNPTSHTATVVIVVTNPTRPPLR